MARPIFISYRRADSLATSGRLRDRLAAEFGAKRVFIDVDDIPHGRDFVLELERQVAACSVLLVIIAPGWIDARDERGNRRLENPEDFARIEVRAALSRNDIAVIPVLVDGAQMPSPEELPNDLKPLARRHAIELRNSYFGPDADRLIRSIRQELKEQRPVSAGTLAVGVSLVVAAIAGIALFVTLVDRYDFGRSTRQGTPGSDSSEARAEKPISGDKLRAEPAPSTESTRNAVTAVASAPVVEGKISEEKKPDSLESGANSKPHAMRPDDRRREEAGDARRPQPDSSRASIQPAGSATPPDRGNAAVITDSGLLREIHGRLYELNFDPGSPDDGASELMRGAIREFETQSGLAQTGAPTEGLLQRLRGTPSVSPWGAIVYARSTNKWGMAWGHQTRAEAIAKARSSCGDRSSQCAVEVSFFSGECAAFAHSDKGWAISARTGLQQARDAALGDCRKKGEACSLITAVCADGTHR